MSETTDIQDILAKALRALKPAFVPMRSLKAAEGQTCDEVILEEVDQTILPRLLTFVTLNGERLVIFAAERRVHSVRPTEGGGVGRTQEAILKTLQSYCEGLASVTVASAPPPASVTPKGEGHFALDLRAALRGEVPNAEPEEAPSSEPETPSPVPDVPSPEPEVAQSPLESPVPVEAQGQEEHAPEDDIEAIYQKVGKSARGVVIRSKRGRVFVKSEDDTIKLDDHIVTVATDMSENFRFLNEAIPGAKLIIHSKTEKNLPSVAFTAAEEKTLLTSFDTEKLASVMQAWQSISKNEKSLS